MKKVLTFAPIKGWTADDAKRPQDKMDTLSQWVIQEWNNGIKDTHIFDLAAEYLNFDDGWLL